MPNITVYNLHSGSITMPGGYYVSTIPAGGHATFDVRDSQEYIDRTSVQRLITKGYIRIELDSGDTADRPLAVYTSATLPSAGNFTAGTLVWNSSTRELLESNGTSWSTAIDGASALITAGADVSAYRFVGLDTSGDLVTSPTATERWAGVSAEAISNGDAGKVNTSGRAMVMPSADLAANDELVAVAGGFAAPYTASAITLGTNDTGADASDDIDQSNLPDQVTATCAADETGNTLVIYGDVGGNYTKETVTLGTAGSYTSTNTFAAIYGLETTAESTGTIDIRDASLNGLLIPQIAATTAARKYGAFEPGTSTDPEGHEVQILAGGANASDVLLLGTDYAGNEQAEVVTMNGTTAVESTLAYRSLTSVFIGADGIVWNAGATSEYDTSVAANAKREIRAYAPEAATTAGSATNCIILPQNQFLVQGESPAVFFAGQYTGNPGGASATLTVPGVLATDVIVATLNAQSNAAVLEQTERTAADTLTFTFDVDPGASTIISVLVFRP